MSKFNKTDYETKSFSYLSSYRKTLLVGPAPPPLGGVSVYLYRLNKLLNNSEHYHFIGGGIGNYIKLFFKLF